MSGAAPTTNRRYRSCTSPDWEVPALRRGFTPPGALVSGRGSKPSIGSPTLTRGILLIAAGTLMHRIAPRGIRRGPQLSAATVANDSMSPVCEPR